MKIAYFIVLFSMWNFNSVFCGHGPKIEPFAKPKPVFDDPLQRKYQSPKPNEVEVKAAEAAQIAIQDLDKKWKETAGESHGREDFSRWFGGGRKGTIWAESPAEKIKILNTELDTLKKSTDHAGNDPQKALTVVAKMMDTANYMYRWRDHYLSNYDKREEAFITFMKNAQALAIDIIKKSKNPGANATDKIINWMTILTEAFDDTLFEEYNKLQNKDLEKRVGDDTKNILQMTSTKKSLESYQQEQRPPLQKILALEIVLHITDLVFEENFGSDAQTFFDNLSTKNTKLFTALDALGKKDADLCDYILIAMLDKQKYVYQASMAKLDKANLEPNEKKQLRQEIALLFIASYYDVFNHIKNEANKKWATTYLKGSAIDFIGEVYKQSMAGLPSDEFYAYEELLEEYKKLDRSTEQPALDLMKKMYAVTKNIVTNNAIYFQLRSDSANREKASSEIYKEAYGLEIDIIKKFIEHYDDYHENLEAEDLEAYHALAVKAAQRALILQDFLESKKGRFVAILEKLKKYLSGSGWFSTDKVTALAEFDKDFSGFRGQFKKNLENTDSNLLDGIPDDIALNTIAEIDSVLTSRSIASLSVEERQRLFAQFKDVLEKRRDLTLKNYAPDGRPPLRLKDLFSTKSIQDQLNGRIKNLDARMTEVMNALLGAEMDHSLGKPTKQRLDTTVIMRALSEQLADSQDKVEQNLKQSIDLALGNTQSHDVKAVTALTGDVERELTYLSRKTEFAPQDREEVSTLIEKLKPYSLYSAVTGAMENALNLISHLESWGVIIDMGLVLQKPIFQVASGSVEEQAFTGTVGNKSVQEIINEREEELAKKANDEARQKLASDNAMKKFLTDRNIRESILTMPQDQLDIVVSLVKPTIDKHQYNDFDELFVTIQSKNMKPDSELRDLQRRAASISDKFLDYRREKDNLVKTKELMQKQIEALATIQKMIEAQKISIGQRIVSLPDIGALVGKVRMGTALDKEQADVLKRYGLIDQRDDILVPTYKGLYIEDMAQFNRDVALRQQQLEYFIAHQSELPLVPKKSVTLESDHLFKQYNFDYMIPLDQLHTLQAHYRSSLIDPLNRTILKIRNGANKANTFEALKNRSELLGIQPFLVDDAAFLAKKVSSDWTPVDQGSLESLVKHIQEGKPAQDFRDFAQVKSKLGLEWYEVVYLDTDLVGVLQKKLIEKKEKLEQTRKSAEQPLPGEKFDFRAVGQVADVLLSLREQRIKKQQEHYEALERLSAETKVLTNKFTAISGKPTQAEQKAYEEALAKITDQINKKTEELNYFKANENLEFEALVDMRLQGTPLSTDYQRDRAGSYDLAKALDPKNFDRYSVWQIMSDGITEFFVAIGTGIVIVFSYALGYPLLVLGKIIQWGLGAVGAAAVYIVSKSATEQAGKITDSALAAAHPALSLVSPLVNSSFVKDVVPALAATGAGVLFYQIGSYAQVPGRALINLARRLRDLPEGTRLLQTSFLSNAKNYIENKFKPEAAVWKATIDLQEQVMKQKMDEARRARNNLVKLLKYYDVKTGKWGSLDPNTATSMQIQLAMIQTNALNQRYGRESWLMTRRLSNAAEAWVNRSQEFDQAKKTMIALVNETQRKAAELGYERAQYTAGGWALNKLKGATYTVFDAIRGKAASAPATQHALTTEELSSFEQQISDTYQQQKADIEARQEFWKGEEATAKKGSLSLALIRAQRNFTTLEEVLAAKQLKAAADALLQEKTEQEKEGVLPSDKKSEGSKKAADAQAATASAIAV